MTEATQAGGYELPLDFEIDQAPWLSKTGLHLQAALLLSSVPVAKEKRGQWLKE
jgi:hypothetical protein